MVDFSVRVMGGSTIAGLVPSLKAWLVRFARHAIISYYVLPEQWTFRLAPVSMLACFCLPCLRNSLPSSTAVIAAAATVAAALLLPSRGCVLLDPFQVACKVAKHKPVHVISASVHVFAAEPTITDSKSQLPRTKSRQHWHLCAKAV